MNLLTKILGNRRHKKSAKSLRHAWRFVHEHLEARTLLAAIPTATLVTTPQSPLIGETATFELGFQNTSPTDTGYGPYLDLTLPAIDADGDDGITFQSATYLGTPLAATVLTFDASGEVLHPLAKDSMGPRWSFMEPLAINWLCWPCRSAASRQASPRRSSR